MVQIPDTQRAWTVVRQGIPAKALELKSDWPVQKKLAPGHVLVRIQAAALNPIGWKLMLWIPNLFSNRPHVAEHDFAGEVVDGNGTEFSDGDQVFGFNAQELTQKTRQGALQHYIQIPVDFIVPRPLNVSPVEAAGITLTSQTAYQALFDKGNLEAGQTIFINGGSSAVGAYAIQLAKASGAKVVATASGKNENFVKSMGADEFIDYTQVDLPVYLSQNPPSTKYNIVFDAVGLLDPSLYTRSEAYLAPNGIFVSSAPVPQKGWGAELWNVFRTIGAIITPRLLGGTKRKYAIVMLKNKKADLQALQKHFADGSLKPIVDSVYEFDDALKAYDRILSKRAVGKVIVKVDPNVK